MYEHALWQMTESQKCFASRNNFPLRMPMVQINKANDCHLHVTDVYLKRPMVIQRSKPLSIHHTSLTQCLKLIEFQLQFMKPIGFRSDFLSCWASPNSVNQQVATLRGLQPCCQMLLVRLRHELYL